MNIRITLAAALLATLPAMTRAAVANDEVTSAKLKEADGTSGQNTNSGSGVKTGHLQNGAVTADKLGVGAVTATKLGSGAVVSGHIQDGAVTTQKLAITNVRLVADGGDRFANGAALVAAVASIGDASPDRPYLVKVMPGVYDLGAGSLQMKPFVDVEGSGMDTTVIVSTVTSESGIGDCGGGTVRMAPNSTLRQLTALNNPPTGSGHANAVAIQGVANARAEFVHAIAQIPGEEARDLFTRYIGFCVEGINPATAEPAEAVADLVHVRAEGINLGNQGNGIRVVADAHMTVTDSLIVGTSDWGSGYPINASGDEGEITVNNCTLVATSAGDATGVWSSGHVTRVSNSRIVLKGYASGGGHHGFNNSRKFSMFNSTVEDDAENGTDRAPVDYEAWGEVNIVNSRLPGYRENLCGKSLFGNYDEFLQPAQGTCP